MHRSRLTTLTVAAAALGAVSVGGVAMADNHTAVERDFVRHDRAPLSSRRGKGRAVNVAAKQRQWMRKRGGR